MWVSKRNGLTGGDLEQKVSNDNPQQPGSENAEDSGNGGETPGDDAVEVDAREVAKACLKALSRDIGF